MEVDIPVQAPDQLQAETSHLDIGLLCGAQELAAVPRIFMETR